jgi:hypothetical protein
MWGVKRNTWNFDNTNERLGPLPPSRYSDRATSRWNTDNSPRNMNKFEDEQDEEEKEPISNWKSENINGTLWRSFTFSDKTDDKNKFDDDEEEGQGPLSTCACHHQHVLPSRPSCNLPPRKAPMHYHAENMKEIVDEDRKANLKSNESCENAKEQASNIRHETEEKIKETISNIQKKTISNLKRVIISVPNTKVSVIMEANKNPIVVMDKEPCTTRLSKFEHLFEYSFLQEWFYEFYSNKNAVLQFREDESSMTVVSTSFTPAHAFQWHAFCGNLSCNLQSGTFTTEKDDSLSLPLLLLDEKDLLREACKKQFHDFIRKGLSPYL